MAYPLFSKGSGKGVIVANSSTLVLSANPQRVFARFTNDSDEEIYLMLGETAKKNRGIRLDKATNPNNFWEINNDNRYIGSVYAICSSGNKNLVISESNS